jgi:putative tricarboxylic transport membrane protein
MYGAYVAGIGWGAEGPKAGFFPFYVGVFIVAMSVFNVVAALRIEPRQLFAEWSQLGQVVSVIIPTAIYVGAIPWLGLYVASFLLIAGFMRWLGKYGWGLIAAVSIGVPLLAYLAFEKWFLVPLPKGPLEELLGL